MDVCDHMRLIGIPVSSMNLGTTLMEQYIVLRAVGKLLAEKGIEMVRSMAGEYLTVQEMAGFQMFIAKMDDELIALFDAPCDTPGWTVR